MSWLIWLCGASLCLSSDGVEERVPTTNGVELVMDVVVRGAKEVFLLLVVGCCDGEAFRSRLDVGEPAERNSPSPLHIEKYIVIMVSHQHAVQTSTHLCSRSISSLNEVESFFSCRFGTDLHREVQSGST